MSQQTAPSNPGMGNQAQGSTHHTAEALSITRNELANQELQMTQETMETDRVSVETAATGKAVPQTPDQPIEAKLVSCVAVMACMDFYPQDQVLEAANELYAEHGMGFKAADLAALIQKKQDQASAASPDWSIVDPGHPPDDGSTHYINVRSCEECVNKGLEQQVKCYTLQRKNTI